MANLRATIVKLVRGAADAIEKRTEVMMCPKSNIWSTFFHCPTCHTEIPLRMDMLANTLSVDDTPVSVHVTPEIHEQDKANVEAHILHHEKEEAWP